MLEVSSKEARELVCHTCGFVNMIGEKYCSECGAPLNLEIPAPVSIVSAPLPPPPAPPASLPPRTPPPEEEAPVAGPGEKLLNCRYCGSKNTAGSKYCFECGAPLVSHTYPNRSVQKTQSAVRSRQNYRPQDEEENEGPAPLPPNTVLQGRYQITKRIGQGGMGAIYLADDLRFSQRVAVVKEMLDHFTDPEQRRLATHNFDREAEMLANLKHPGIPEVYDRFTEGNRHYLVMEYVNGSDLEQRMMNQDNAPFEEEQVIDWAIQICEILSYMHRQNPPIVYRDMKPANLILNEEGRIYVVDFGIARHFNPTKKGTMIGTQGYAPPEQYRGQVEPRSDIYALAATLHHLLTGRDPQAEAPFTFPTVRELNSRVSVQTDKLIARCLNMEAEGRYRDAADMIEALRKTRRRQTPGVDTIPGTMPLQSRGISTALMKLGFSHRFLSVEWLLRFNIVLLSAIVILLVILLAKN
ncbi:MAG: protein kinase domain-containing protein [Candidatus Sericytochromatia bacterium]